MDNKNRVLSLSLSPSPPSLSTKVIVRARSLVRSFALRNSLMSLVSLSSQPIFLLEEKRKSIFICVYIQERERKGDKHRIESNTLNSINFFFEIYRRNHLQCFPSLLSSRSVHQTTNIYSAMKTTGLTCHRLEEGRRIMCLKINDLQLWLTSFSLNQRQHIFTTPEICRSSLSISAS